MTACLGPFKSDIPRHVEVRKVSGEYVLYRNGVPFTIRGAAGHEHLKLLSEMGGNTIRIYDTTNLGAILDSANQHNIAVIAGIWMMGDQEMDYTDTFKVRQQYNRIKNVVQRYKDHPAVLMWCLGNEISYRVAWKEIIFPNEVWTAFRDVVKMIHEIDPEHPVTTTITNYQKKRLLYFNLHVPEIDVIGINTFGRLKVLQSEASLYNWYFDKPYFLAEWAIKGPWESDESPAYTPIEETSSRKAEEYLNYYENYIPHNDPYFLGSCVFYWGQKQEHTHTWFGLFSEKGEHSEMLESIRKGWSGEKPANYVPRLDSILINGAGRNDTLILSPGEVVNAYIYLHDIENDSLITEWEVLPDVWHFDYRSINYKPHQIPGLFLINSLRESRFTAPEEPGVYRLHAKVIDKEHNHFATANLAFLVMK